MPNNAVRTAACALVKKGLLSEIDALHTMTTALQLQKNLIDALLDEHAIPPDILAQAFSDYYLMDYCDLSTLNKKTAPKAVLNKIPVDKFNLLPIKQHKHTLTVALSNPLDIAHLNDIEFITGLDVTPVFVSHTQLTQWINALKNTNEYDNDDQNTVDFVDRLLSDAIVRNASDIHIEPQKKTCRIRMRIDGILHHTTDTKSELTRALNNRIKILADLDIAEHRLPQDGRFTFTTHNVEKRDCRVSTCPTLFGEKIVLRLLNPEKQCLHIEALGMNPHQQKLFTKALEKPQGLILVTGPTGSGKTITLYSALKTLNQTHKNISTVEDPIEIQLAGMNQVNIQPNIGFGFAQGLRTFLRQDPDIIMLGEIRDRETAEIALRAAHTGHLVLSTLHTNSAAESVTRLLNMGIAPYNLASALTLVVAQRLARKLCDRCKIPDPLSPNTFKPKGCAHCTEGYQSRCGVFEVMPITQALSHQILQSKPLKPEGMETLQHAAQQKVAQGITSLEEIYRVIAH